MNAVHKILIIGQGLAGTALAWCLRERGMAFVIVDPNEAGTCSKIAAGLVTPITGKRVKPSWRVDELLPEAMTFYQRIEQTLHAKFFHPLPLVRLFKESREVEWWRGRAGEAGIHQWIDAESPLVDKKHFHSELGGMVQRHAGWLDTAGYLKASRELFAKEARLVQDVIREDEIEDHDDQVLWRGEIFSAAVFCRGADERHATRFFPWLRFECARGVIATLRADIPEQSIVNRGCWILPQTNGAWRAGSTYEFDLKTPMENSVADLHGKL
ncbi:MAG: FAD-dependent oxidoreductase, partial [Verrucomicrobiaceae bacterium]